MAYLLPDWLNSTKGYGKNKPDDSFAYTLTKASKPIHGESRLPAGAKVKVEIRNREVFLSCYDAWGSRALPIDALNLEEVDKVNLLGQAIYRYAQRGYDPDTNAKAGACHIVDDLTKLQKDGRPTQRIFIASNQNHVSRLQRPDAEANALNHAKDILKGQLRVRETYLTLSHNDTEPNDIITPCGTCREEMTNPKFVAEDALVYCFPCKKPNEGQVYGIDDQTEAVEPDFTNTPNNHVFKMKTMRLVPNKRVKFADRLGVKRTAEMIKEGWDWVKNGDYSHGEDGFLPLTEDAETQKKHFEAEEEGRNSELPIIQGENFTLSNIDMFLKNKLKAAYRDLSQRNDDKVDIEKLSRMRAVVIVVEGDPDAKDPAMREDKCYSSMYIDGQGLGAKPLGELSAMSNAFNPTRVKEVFMMDIKPAHILNMLADDKPFARNIYSEARDRLLKSARIKDPEEWKKPSHRNILNEMIHGRCELHTIPLTSGKRTDEELKQLMKTETIEKSYACAFNSPNSAGVASGVGCC